MARERLAAFQRVSNIDPTWHRAQRVRAEKRGDAQAELFHLDWLLKAPGEDHFALLKRRARLLRARFKASVTDPHVISELAWAAAIVPGAVTDYRAMLAVYEAQEDDKPEGEFLRVRGALLLRAGRHEAACTALKTAAKHRPLLHPPIEEVLLALACRELKRPAEARLYLERAKWRSLARLAALYACRTAAIGLPQGTTGNQRGEAEFAVLLREAGRALAESK